MECSRNGCPHCMCDFYVDGIGYVCDDCIKEFKKWLAKQDGDMPNTERQIHKKLEVFIDTPYDGTDDETKITVDEFFSKHDRCRD